MSAKPTVAVTSTRAVVQAAARRGVDVDALLAAHAIEPERLADPRERLPAGTAMAIWRDAAARAMQPELHVWAAIELPWGAYRVIDTLAASATGAGEGLELISRYFRIVHDTIRLPIEAAPDGGGTMRIVTRGGEPVPSIYVDYTLCACLFRLGLAGAVLTPEVHLRREAPADRAGHVKALGPNLRFGAEEDRVVLDAAQWATPLPAGDAVLRSVLAEHADLLMKNLPDPGPEPLQDVSAALADALPRGRPELAFVAGQLGVSTRTLQRRLSEQGITWSSLLSRTRQELAERLLLDPSLSVDDVAVLLGYAEASTFHRAFRQWTGQTPGAWRASGRAA